MVNKSAYISIADNNEHKPGFWRKTGSVAASCGVAYGVHKIGSVFNKLSSKNFCKYKESITSETNTIFNEYADKALEQFGKNGLKPPRIIDMSSSPKTSEQLFARFIGKKTYLRFNRQASFIKESILRDSSRYNSSKDIELLVKGSMLSNYKTPYPYLNLLLPVESVAKGENSVYLSRYNKIFNNRKNNAVALFHESGHAKVGSLLGFIGKYTKLAIPVIFACAILKKNDNKDECQGDFVNFVKKHCVGLAFLTKLPTLLDEGLASLNGIRLAKNAGAPKDLLKIINKINGKAYMTYLGSTLTLMGAVFAASKIRDSV